MFDKSAGAISPNRLVIRLQPDEGVKLWLMIKDPGPGGMRLRRVPLDMSFAETFAARHADAVIEAMRPVSSLISLRLPRASSVR